MEKILIVILEACDFKSCEVHNTYELVDFHGDKNNVRIQLKLNYIVDCNTIIVGIC